jgi:hypothetical protein
MYACKALDSDLKFQMSIIWKPYVLFLWKIRSVKRKQIQVYGNELKPTNNLLRKKNKSHRHAGTIIDILYSWSQTHHRMETVV